ncbi:MAG: phosphoribosylformylglycinamidine synthase subunit PurS [Acidimicrobiia bacterium]
MRYRIEITRRDGLSDPEGVTTKQALLDLGYDEVEDVRFGRTIYIETGDTDAGRQRLTEMCERLLANPVIEDFEIVAIG